MKVQYKMRYSALDDPETSLNWKITKAHYISLFHLLAAHSTNSKSFKKVEADQQTLIT